MSFQNSILDMYGEQPIQLPTLANDLIKAPEKQKVSVQLTNKERGYYSGLLSQIDPQDSAKVYGKEAVEFFVCSGLPRDVLKEIWRLSSYDMECLQRDEFYVALKLISYAQNGITIGLENIKNNVPSPLPKFDFNQYKKNNNRQRGDSRHDEQQQAQLSQKADSQLTSSNSSGKKQQQTSDQELDPYSKLFEITEDKLKKYFQYYETFDPKHTGQIQASEAKELFLRSGLPAPYLKLIWDQVDIGNKGYLLKYEFIVAIHLLTLGRANVQLPQYLHPVLSSFISESFQKENQEKENSIEINKLASEENKKIEEKQSIQIENKQNQLQQSQQEFKSPQEPQQQPKKEISNSFDDQFGQFQQIPLQQQKQQSPTISAQQPQPQLQEALQCSFTIDNKNSDSRSRYESIDLLKKEQQQKTTETLIQSKKAQEMKTLQSSVLQAEHQLDTEFTEMRKEHTAILDQKKKDVDFLENLVAVIQTMNKKFNDENLFLKSELKKIEEQEQEFQKKIGQSMNELNQKIDENSNLKQTIIKKANETLIGIANKTILSINETKAKIQQDLKQQQCQDILKSSDIPSVDIPLQQLQQTVQALQQKADKARKFDILENITLDNQEVEQPVELKQQIDKNKLITNEKNIDFVKPNQQIADKQNQNIITQKNDSQFKECNEIEQPQEIQKKESIASDNINDDQKKQQLNKSDFVGWENFEISENKKTLSQKNELSLNNQFQTEENKLNQPHQEEEKQCQPKEEQKEQPKKPIDFGFDPNANQEIKLPEFSQNYFQQQIQKRRQILIKLVRFQIIQ